MQRIPGRPFLALLFVLCLLCLPCPASRPAPAAQTPDKVTLTLLGTTDLHGNLLPLDYYANRPANVGLAKIATLVRRIRAEQPYVLLLDSGDTIQGTPLAYYFARKDTRKPNPTIAVMNALGYDAMALGNHEFNFGLAVLWKAKREARFPILAANLLQEYTQGVPYFRPYVVKNVGGVRVGIVGFVTPGVPRWEIPAHYRGYCFEQIVDAARRIVPEVRRQADLVVVVAHSGLGPDPAAPGANRGVGIPGEDAMHALARQVPGIDVILFGHSHRELPERIINGVLLAQAKNWGQSLARVDVTLERDPTRRWRVASKRSAAIPVTDAVLPDPHIVQLAQPYHEAAQAYLDTPIASSPAEMDAWTARYEDHPLVDLIHQVQTQAGRADVSLATMFLPGARIPAGKVTVRQIAALYIYENTLYTVEMNGAQLKDALEHAASFFPAWPFRSGEPLRLPGYNADSAEGVHYTMDLARPPGRRIRELTFKGKPLDAAAKLRVAVNNYRYGGGGGYHVFKGLPVVYRSPQEVRELLIEYVTRKGHLPAAANGNWSIVPREAQQAILRQAREREGRAAAGNEFSR